MRVGALIKDSTPLKCGNHKAKCGVQKAYMWSSNKGQTELWAERKKEKRSYGFLKKILDFGAQNSYYIYILCFYLKQLVAKTTTIKRIDRESEQQFTKSQSYRKSLTLTT